MLLEVLAKYGLRIHTVLSKYCNPCSFTSLVCMEGLAQASANCARCGNLSIDSRFHHNFRILRIHRTRGLRLNQDAVLTAALQGA